MKHIHTLKGVSLLETLIYVAVVVLLTVVVVNTAMVMTTASAKTRLKRNVLSEAGISVERITREIRLADSIDISGSTLGTHPGVLRLNTIVSVDDETPTTREFYLEDGALMMKEGTSTAVPLTSAVNINNLIFYRIVASTSEAASVVLTAEDTFRGLSELHTFYSTAVLRRSY